MARVSIGPRSGRLSFRRLDRYAAILCPLGDVFGQCYHWSLM
jgi:hypothetical protein